MAGNVTVPQDNAASLHSSAGGGFFRSCGWMIFATVMGGILMWAVHKVATSYLDGVEYGMFASFLRALNLVTIPACGLQAFFAQKTSTVQHEQSLSDLRELCIGVVRWILGICAFGAIIVFCFQSKISVFFKVPASFLWVALPVVLVMFLRPVGVGILQGRQNFLWVGCAQIADGAVRLGCIFLILTCLCVTATGALWGVFAGVSVTICLCLFQTKDLWRKKTRVNNPFHLRWLLDLVPLTLGAGIPLFMIGADALVVQATFPSEQVKLYAAAGIMTQALIFFTLPIATVMFPKIARSAAIKEETSVRMLALGTTAFLVGVVVIGTFIMPTLPIRIMFNVDYLPAAKVLPWFALSMFPLSLATVLINDLLARAYYKCVPFLWLVLCGYVVALCVWHNSFKQIIFQIGVFNMILFVVCVVFAFPVGKQKQESRQSGVFVE